MTRVKLSPQKEELLDLETFITVGQAGLVDTLTAIGRATIEGKDTTLLVRAYHRFAKSLEPLIERRETLRRETDGRLS